MTPERHGGPIDPWSEFDLYDVIAGEIPQGEATEYEGLHLYSQGDGEFLVQPDGYAGSLATIQAEDFGDVLELVDELNGHLVEWHDLQEFGDLEERVERVGKLITSDPEKAEEAPDLYLLVPENTEVPA